MHRVHHFVALLLLYAGCAAVAAPPVEFTHLSVADGLSQSSVSAAVEDEDGYLWFGTQDGLDRYDGYRFKTFRPDPNNANSLSHHTVGFLLADGDFIWAGTPNGLDRVQRSSGQVRRYLGRSHTPESSDAAPYVTALQRAGDGVVWVGTRFGLYRYQRADERFVPVALGSNAQPAITALAPDGKGDLWVATRREAYHYSAATGEASLRFSMPSAPDAHWFAITCVVHQPGKALWVSSNAGLYRVDDKDARTRVFRGARGGLSDDVVLDLYVDGKGALWVGTEKGLDRFQDSRFRHYLAAGTHHPHSMNNRVLSIFETREGELWIGSSSGVHRYQRQQDRFEHFSYSAGQPHGLSAANGEGHYEILLQDSSGVLWISAALGGLNKRLPGLPRFRHVVAAADPLHPEVSENHVVRAVVEQGSALWVGYDGGGLRRFAVDSAGRYQVSKRYVHDAGDGASLVDNDVSALAVTGGGLWVGAHLGLDWFDPRAQRFFHLLPAGKNSKPVRVLDILAHGDHTLWLATDSGLFRTAFALRKGMPKLLEVHHYSLDPVHPHHYYNGVNAVIASAGGNLILGTEDGVLQFHTASGDFQPLSGQGTVTPAGEWIYALAEAPDGDLWVGTRDGLMRGTMTRRNRKWLHFGVENGLPNNQIYALRLVGQALWLSSNTGLTRYDLQRGNFRNYALDDGLQSLEFSHRVAYRGPSGKLYFGGINGFNVIEPETIHDNPRPPRVHITGLSAHGHALLGAQPLAFPLRLAANQTTLKFDYVGLHYVHSHRIRYQYRLQGLESGWTDAGTRRVASYANLPPGEYRFLVKAANSDGVWTPQAAGLDFRIPPPLWATTWAYVAYAVLFLFALSAYVRIRQGALRRHNRALSEAVAQRTEKIRVQHETIACQARQLRRELRFKNDFFANVSHEFRTPLMLILGPLETLLKQVKNAPMRRTLQNIEDNGKNLLHLVEQILSLEKLRSHPEEATQAQDLGALVAQLVERFQSAATAKGITLRDSLEGQLEGQLYVDAIHGSLGPLIGNLLSNAIKYTPEGGTVEVIARRRDDTVVVDVRDTGIGIEKNQLERIFQRFYRVSGSEDLPGSGIGLAYAKALADANKGRIAVHSIFGQGSTFSVHLPATAATASTTQPARTVATDPPLLQMPASVPGLRSSVAKNAATILVVDDNRQIRDYLVGVLGARYRCITAADGRQGLRTALQQMPALILSDVMMPGLDGYALCEQLKTDIRTSHIPILLLTARGDQASRMHGLRQRADGYLTKPVSAEELQLRIANVLATRQALRQRLRRAGGIDGEIDHPESGQLTATDRRWLQRLRSELDAHCGASGYGVADMARATNLSSRTLNRKLHALLDLSPAELLKNRRLDRAQMMLTTTSDPVGRIAERCGFSSQSYFATCFKQRFGKTPKGLQRGLPSDDSPKMAPDQAW